MKLHRLVLCVKDRQSAIFVKPKKASGSTKTGSDWSTVSAIVAVVSQWTEIGNRIWDYEVRSGYNSTAVTELLDSSLHMDPMFLPRTVLWSPWQSQARNLTEDFPDVIKVASKVTSLLYSIVLGWRQSERDSIKYLWLVAGIPNACLMATFQALNSLSHSADCRSHSPDP